MIGPVLDIRDLSIAFGDTRALSNVSLTLERGRTLGLVGASGSGKSLTALAAIGLLPNQARVSGTVQLAGHDVTKVSPATMRALRGQTVGMIFQEPMTALNPVHRARDQVAETVVVHDKGDWSRARELAQAQLDRVGLSSAQGDRFPHQLSGGERQRVLIAAATVLSPDLLIADEPTTALDVLRQREVLNLLGDLTAEQGSSLLFITHDIAVMAEMVDRIVVLRGGIVDDRFDTPNIRGPERTQYTQRLVSSASPNAVNPSPERRGEHAPVLKLTNTTKRYRRGWFEPPIPPALDCVDLELKRGEILGLVGPSGCGKSTLARTVLALERPDHGTVSIDGKVLWTRGTNERDWRRKVQIVFQDPNGSFDPRRTVGWSIEEPLDLIGITEKGDADRRVARALERVSMPSDIGHRYPHQFSGGQRQRLAIARAIVIEPTVIVADEPVSALDVTVRGAILETFAELREQLGTALLFISHDLDVVRSIADRVAVMKRGRIVEIGVTADIFSAPQHEMTKRLLAAKPDLDGALQRFQRTNAATADARITHARV